MPTRRVSLLVPTITAGLVCRLLGHPDYARFWPVSGGRAVYRSVDRAGLGPGGPGAGPGGVGAGLGPGAYRRAWGWLRASARAWDWAAGLGHCRQITAFIAASVVFSFGLAGVCDRRKFVPFLENS